jgi:RNA polymerase-binding transcription factor
LAIAAQCPHDPRVVNPGEEVNEMVVELPPGYQPSADEEFMNPKQVEYFSRRLQQSRAELRRELDAIPPPEAYDITQEGDQTDHASAASEREFALQNGERIQRLMRQTERALSKLEDGTYGYCEDTGEPIDLKRLMAQPTTSLSLAAQQAREGRTG